mgnify:CR=1 FL=1
MHIYAFTLQERDRFEYIEEVIIWNTTCTLNDSTVSAFVCFALFNYCLRIQD